MSWNWHRAVCFEHKVPPAQTSSACCAWDKLRQWRSFSKYQRCNAPILFHPTHSLHLWTWMHLRNVGGCRSQNCLRCESVCKQSHLGTCIDHLQGTRCGWYCHLSILSWSMQVLRVFFLWLERFLQQPSSCHAIFQARSSVYVSLVSPTWLQKLRHHQVYCQLLCPPTCEMAWIGFCLLPFY